MINRINITIDDDLLNKIDSYSKKIYLSRSSFISLALVTYLDYVESLPRPFSDAYKSITGRTEV